MNDKLDFISRGSVVKRFHTMRTIHTQNVAEHSFGVACLAWLLANGAPSAELMLAALLHDLAEHTTGDIPAPAKRRLNITAQMCAYEQDALQAVGLEMPTLSSEDEKILKFADVSELLLFCVSELALGNRHMSIVAERGLSYLDELRPYTETMVELHEYILEKLNDQRK